MSAAVAWAMPRLTYCRVESRAWSWEDIVSESPIPTPLATELPAMITFRSDVTRATPGRELALDLESAQTLLVAVTETERIERPV